MKWLIPGSTCIHILVNFSHIFCNSETSEDYFPNLIGHEKIALMQQFLNLLIDTVKHVGKSCKPKF